jgi:hypothetical protein
VNAKRFGSPTADALERLRARISPAPSLTKKSSAFGLSMTWKRSPDKHTGVEDEGYRGLERRSKVREIMRRMWFERGDEDEDGDEISVGGSSRRGSGPS